MTVAEIIQQIRWCIDEESNNTYSISDEKDDEYMDNIIKAKINDALHWLAITASSSPILAEAKKVTGDTTTTFKVEDFDTERNIGVITMPSNTEILNISRVRGKGWQKAAVPVEDTEDEALMMFDDTSRGTADRPQAAIMRENPIKLLLQPKPDAEVVVSYVGLPTSINSETTEVTVSDKLKNAFIYYIAFLLLSAYDDSKANQMYTIALQQLGVQTSK